MCGVIVECDVRTGLAKSIDSYILGANLKKYLIMAGHSHWAGIKHKKGKADKLRANLFSKLSKRNYSSSKIR